MLIRFVFCTAISAVLTTLILGDDPCKFTDSVKGTIDLSSLSGKDGNPKFKDVRPPSGGYVYSYNPCEAFSEGSGCTNVAACQVDPNSQNQFTLSRQDSAKWDAGAGSGSDATLKYSLQDGAVLRQVEITLKCDTNVDGDLVSLGEFGTALYKFELTSKCACWDGCKGGGGGGGGGGDGGKGGGVAFGTVFIIILVSLAFVYLVGFSIFNYARRGERGLGVLPHREFWTTLPLYAKTGVLFLVRCVTRRGSGDYASV